MNDNRAISDEPAQSRELSTSRVYDVPAARVFRAFADPAQLAKWWGPKGFTNTFREFDFRPGGAWRFLMHGPDGADYQNESIFVEIVPSSRIVLNHVSAPRFELTITIGDVGGKTRVGWRQLFESAEVRDRIARFAGDGNEQNLDRLGMHLTSALSPQTHPKDHWENVYATKAPAEVSWFQEHASLSMKLIREAGVPRDAAIIDAGGGASRLADDLLDGGFANITVLDISGVALSAARARLGERATDVRWIESDLLGAPLAEHAYDLWHDRAVFHFMTSPDDRRAYVRQALRAIRPGGFLVAATFAEDGPTKCSGLSTARYSADELRAELGPEFTLLADEKESHTTPSGNVQRFVYCLFRR
jgi:uncharacterized protein YndB with AHSA1/START domain/ubiquinone/menaquinone biosynthesis C-methylase UbiE